MAHVDDLVDELVLKYREHVRELRKLLRRYGTRSNLAKARRELDEAVDTLIRIMLIKGSQSSGQSTS